MSLCKNTFDCILGLLGPRDLCRCSRVSRQWYRWVKQTPRWREFLKIFPILGQFPITQSWAWLKAQKNPLVLQCLLELHFRDDVIVSDISDGNQHVFHVKVYLWDRHEGSINYHDPLFIWSERRHRRLKARYGRCFIADWPGPTIDHFFNPYNYFLDTGCQPSTPHSILFRWRFRYRY